MWMWPFHEYYVLCRVMELCNWPCLYLGVKRNLTTTMFDGRSVHLYNSWKTLRLHLKKIKASVGGIGRCQSKRTCKFLEFPIYFGSHPHIKDFNLTRHHVPVNAYILALFISKKNFQHVSMIQTLETPPMLKHTTSFTTSFESYVYNSLCKSTRLIVTHMAESCPMLVFKKGFPLSPSLLRLYIDKLNTYLDEIDIVCKCLFSTMIIIFPYVDDVVMLSK